MVKQRSIPFFLALMLVYFLVRWAYIFGETGILRFYLTDLLFVPAMCTFGLIGVRWIKRDRTLQLRWLHVFSQVLFVSWYFESYLPSSHPKYTGDPIDVVMYVLGGFIFLAVQKKL